VAVLEDVRGHVETVARRGLHRVAAAVDLRTDVLDLDTGRALGRELGHGSVTFSDGGTVNS
jgi:hypothetical protein